MIARFIKSDRLRRETILATQIVNGNDELAAEIEAKCELREIAAGTAFIAQDGDDNDVFVILAGVADVVINGRTIGKRGPGTHVGEMAAIQPSQRRSASCIAAETVVALVLTAEVFADLGQRYPQIYHSIAKELSRRLLERNATINAYRERVRLFIISSAEALPIARMVQTAFEHDPFLTVVWTDGVFKVASYALQDLEAAVEASDFAIAIAHADDMTASRGQDWPSPRDNVIFELGMFVGRLGRARAILLEPREDKVKLPSDLSGVTTITYRYEPGQDATALLAPACNRLREHILTLGPYNG